MTKLARSTMPSGHTVHDFECFGPAAERDGSFSGTMICDLGCFTQDGKDSNKFYHAAVVQSKLTQSWLVYFEWGRTGHSAPDFQFHECCSQAEAIQLYEKQLHSKNDKRGEWFDHPTLGKILRAKAGKDCYLVRPQVVRSTGLPSAKTICKKVVKTTTAAEATKKTARHAKVEMLLRDINIGTLNYAKTSMATSSVPTLEAINEARTICTQAANVTSDDDTVFLSNLIYSKIPKKKRQNEDWMLKGENIKKWLDDLDAFEDAVNNINATDVQVSTEPFELDYIEENSELFKFLSTYFKKASKNQHGWIPGQFAIMNAWKISRSDSDRILKPQEAIASKNKKFSEFPIYIPERNDIDNTAAKLYNESNTHLLIHGTRSVNVGGILRQTLKLPAQLKGVSINGAMFGGGLYFADDWRKSAGYTSVTNGYYSAGSGGIASRGAFMFLADVVIGEAYVPTGPKGFTSPPSGYDSVLGKGGVSRVANNEFITYYTESNSLRYLVEFNTK